MDKELFPQKISRYNNSAAIKQRASELKWSVPYAMLCLADDERVNFVRDKIGDWYMNFSTFLDKKLVDEIKKDFDQRIWEIYCTKLFDVKFGLIKKREDGLPDFKTEISGKDTWIEVTAPKNGTEEDGNKLPLISDVIKGGLIVFGGLVNERTDPIALRIKTAIERKIDNYRKKYLKNGVREKDPLIIAINSALFDDGINQEQIALQLFFNMGNTLVTFNKDPKIETIGVFREQRDVANSMKGDCVKVGLFQSDAFKEISCVILTHNNIYNLELNSDGIGSDLLVIFNRYAVNKIDPSCFEFCKRMIPDGDDVRRETPKH
ncbi:MAG: hypothetical protein IPN70_01210 [Candidatus Moraniibacteriota bacterium]|nr:MAG: hypothetical protein IPN70_01210 [Candidatus Moranbacteria bacterium]